MSNTETSLSAQSKQMKTTHGGARKGAGRKRKDDKRIAVNFSMLRSIVETLRNNIQPQHRSRFVETAVSNALKTISK